MQPVSEPFLSRTPIKKKLSSASVPYITIKEELLCNTHMIQQMPQSSCPTNLRFLARHDYAFSHSCPCSARLSISSLPPQYTGPRSSHTHTHTLPRTVLVALLGRAYPCDAAVPEMCKRAPHLLKGRKTKSLSI